MSIVLHVKYTEVDQNSIRCNFCEGVGLCELFSKDEHSKDFAVVSYVKDGVSLPIDKNLIREYQTHHTSFTYQILQ